ncbi:unnamed protein product [Debaryomyces tyrocola]|nr:unnamed protein product [Debaryomyces tyrocola]
MQQIYKMLKMF